MRREEQSFVRVSGGIITSHFVSLMEDEGHGFEYARPETFVRPWREEDAPPQDEEQFLKQVRDAWEHLVRRFNEKFRDIQAGRMNAEDVRRLWQRPVLEALGFEPTSTQKQIVISDRLKYRFSHRGWFFHPGVPKPPVIQILPPKTDPDTRPSRGEPSPHDALQDCLNRHDARWAVLMNETVIRILRDYHHTTVPGYIEFDLEGIFLNRSFPEFLALYRFCHASRFARDPETGKEPLEDYYEVSRQAGEKIGESLRVNVVRAIEELGNGFLDASLIEQLRGDREACQAYYQEILTVVYRIIFMLFAEQRGMLGIGGEHGDLFLEEYSITSLRERVDAFAGRDDRHSDLWEGLCVTFGMMEKGVPALGINAFDGLLFSRGGEQYLKDAKCRNTALMNAIRALTWTVPVTEGRRRRQRIHGRQRISYADISVEEIGAIYESLLDYTPRITEEFEELDGREYRPGEFMLDRRGSERKSTGSYYTKKDLIAELIRSALDPVIDDRLSRAGPDPAAREKALLSIRVCDPACGSGAFLIAASNRLGHELAKVRAGTELPSAKEVQAARRDVLSHCIYGVDLNPMAVELAKVSLWINALVADRPLSFLDHHIRCGNSLIGATPELIAGGIPDGAYTPVEGDAKEVANEIKKANREQRQSRTFAEFEKRVGLAEACAERFAALADCAENDPDAVEAKRREYERLLHSFEYEKERWAADCWCAAFFWPLNPGQQESIPTTETVRMVQAKGEDALSNDVRNEIRRLAEKHRFFHWHLEFPEVFAEGGFDCVLGNPPWEVMTLNEKEFFAFRAPEIAETPGTKRKKMIAALKSTNQSLFQEYLSALRDEQNSTSFIRNSGRFPLTARGKINTFSIFAELARRALAPRGRAGIIVPTGIATDATTADFFGDLVESASLVSLYDFENKNALFPIHRSFKFCLLTMAGMEAGTGAFDLAFFLHTIDDLHDDDRRFTLTPEEILLINPNTKNCPIFRSKRDAEITKAVYRRVPVLINESLGEAGNPWGVSFRQGLFNMTSDSHLFRTREEMEAAGFVLEGNRFVKGEEVWLPLYEAKMFWQFDHRHGTFEGVQSRANTNLPSPTIDQKMDGQYVIIPGYWLCQKEISDELINSNQFLVFRRVSNSTNERTIVSTFIPRTPVNDKGVIISSTQCLQYQLCLLANENSLSLDYIARKKVGGTQVDFFIAKQLPVLPPSTYTPALTDFIAPRVIELTYTAWDLEPFARDVLAEIGEAKWNEWFPENPVGEDGRPHPFIWDEDRRFDLRCDLDALYFHLYEISRDDVDYIMETFPIVKRKDVAAFGSYRTKEVILEKYDELAKEFVRVMKADLPRKDGKIDWKAVIAGGESERVEFKASMSWDAQTKQRNKSLEHTIAKSIASFMNTRGGVLFIGVNDAGEVVGLDGDIKISKRQNEDGMRLRFDDLVKHYLGNRFLPLITVHSIEENGSVYWAVEVEPTVESVFVDQNGEQEFWIRGTSSSRRLSMRETVDYIEKRKKEGIGTGKPAETANTDQ